MKPQDSLTTSPIPSPSPSNSTRQPEVQPGVAVAEPKADGRALQSHATDESGAIPPAPASALPLRLLTKPVVSDLTTSTNDTTTPTSPALMSFGSGVVPMSPRPEKRRKRNYYLQITVSEARRGALPGYEGDRRVEWAVSDADAENLTDSARRTRDALDTLRTFWNDVAPDELGFEEFAWCVFGDDLETAHGSPLPEEDVTTHMAARLAGSTTALSAFLADLRDWDAFRLLIRRRAGRLPVSLETRGDERRRRSRDVDGRAPSPPIEALVPSSPAPDAVQVLSSEAFYFVMSAKEAQWNAQRIELEEALASAERKVRRIVNSVTGALGGAIDDDEEDKRISSAKKQIASVTSTTSSTTNTRKLPTTTHLVAAVRDLPPKSEARRPHRLSKQVSFDPETVERGAVKDRLNDALADFGRAGSAAGTTTEEAHVPTTSVTAPARTWRDLVAGIQPDDETAPVEVYDDSPEGEELTPPESYSECDEHDDTGSHDGSSISTVNYDRPLRPSSSNSLSRSNSVSMAATAAEPMYHMDNGRFSTTGSISAASYPPPPPIPEVHPDLIALPRRSTSSSTSRLSHSASFARRKRLASRPSWLDFSRSRSSVDDLRNGGPIEEENRDDVDVKKPGRAGKFGRYLQSKLSRDALK
ncbi:hypothetical protein HKX48_003171 [Thoreauomyces humboldtii]|nr:hypothetical protein HKX48_003171 [Thoreauomyces humboldtii]